MKSKDCTLIVTSCDAYRDVEAPFIALLRKFWPDCPFDVVLVTETTETTGYDRVIATGKGKTWSEMLVEALDQIETPYVIMEMNDVILSAPVDTANILRRLKQVKEFDAANLRLVPMPPGEKPFRDTDLMESVKNTAYCVSCQPGIWNRQYLRSIAAKTKSAWEFERYGSFMVGNVNKPILVTKTHEYTDVDTVHKGYWVPAGVKLLKDNEIAYDFTIRGMPPPLLKLRLDIKRLIFKLFPWTLIVRIQNIFNAGMK